MKKKNTDSLQQELMDSPDLSQFLSQNQEQFENKSVAELLNRLFEKKHISKAALAKQAGMSEIYLHQAAVIHRGIVCCACVMGLKRRLTKPRNC